MVDRRSNRLALVLGVVSVCASWVPGSALARRRRPTTTTTTTTTSVGLATDYAGTTATTPAANPCDSEEHRRARSLATAGKHDEAAAAFRAIFERDSSVCAQGQMGLELVAARQYPEALDAIEGALGHATDAWVISNRAALDTAQRDLEQRVGSLVVTLDPATPGATVSVAGGPARALPMLHPAHYNVGTLAIEVHVPDQPVIRRSVVINPETVTRETVTIPRASEPGPVVIRPVDPPHVVTPGTPNTGGVSGAGIAVTVVGGVFAITGGVFFGLAEAEYSRYLTDPSCNNATGSPEELCGGSRTTASNFRRIGITGLVVGAAGLTAGIIMIAARVGVPSGNTARTHFTCTPDLASTLGVSCMGTF